MPKTTFDTFKAHLISEIVEDRNAEFVTWTAPKNHIIVVDDIPVQSIEEVFDEDKHHYLCFIAHNNAEIEEDVKVKAKRNYQLYKKV